MPQMPVILLDRLLAQILKGDVEFVLHTTHNSVRQADATGIGQAFQPGGDVAPVAKHVSVLNDDIAEVDAYSEPEAVA